MLALCVSVKPIPRSPEEVQCASRRWRRLAVYFGLANPDERDELLAQEQPPPAVAGARVGATVAVAIVGGAYCVLTPVQAMQAVAFGAVMGAVLGVRDQRERRQALERQRLTAELARTASMPQLLAADLRRTAARPAAAPLVQQDAPRFSVASAKLRSGRRAAARGGHVPV